MEVKNRRRKSAYRFFEEEELFRLISERANYVDTKVVRDIYYAMMKLMVQEIKKNGAFRLPKFGDFFAKFMKERMIKDVNTGQMRYCPQKRLIKFETNNDLKKYLNAYR